MISKRNLNSKYQYQVRVRARIGPCVCGKGDVSAKEDDYVQCAAEESKCEHLWTPWSNPSAPVSPLAEDAPSEAPGGAPSGA